MRKIVIIVLILATNIALCNENNEEIIAKENIETNRVVTTTEEIRLKNLKNTVVKNSLYAMYWNLIAGKNNKKNSNMFENKESYKYLQEVIANEELIVMKEGTCEDIYNCPDTKYMFKIQSRIERPNYDEFDGVFVKKMGSKEELAWEIVKSLFANQEFDSSNFKNPMTEKVMFTSLYMYEEGGGYFVGENAEYGVYVLASNKVRYENNRYYIYIVKKTINTLQH